MKILVANDFFPPFSSAGSETISLQLAEGFLDAGHEVELVTRLKGEDISLWNSSIKLHDLSKQSLDSVLTKVKPDLIHVHNVVNRLEFHSLKTMEAFAPTVTTLHDVMSVTPGKCDVMVTEQGVGPLKVTWPYIWKMYGIRTNLFEKSRKKKIVNSISHRVAVSQALADFLLANGIQINSVIHNGLKPATLPDRQSSRKKWDLSGPVILFAGRISPYKGSRQIADALKLLATPVTLLVASEDDGNLYDLKRRLSHNVTLKFTGWLSRNEMAEAYAASDIVTVPSLCMDSFPTVVLEAMQYGKPCVASCYGGAKEALDPSTGMIINPLHIQELLRAFQTLIEKPETGIEMGRKAQTKFESQFLLDTATSNYLNLFEKVLKNR